ncbi:alpha-L-fucosidase [Coraliomargarita algicola]|uniref:alpha-L-fucosidase n=1 Tax=Coraliomargarita algicola TaxID=3092156 RepID=A0ABZ0RTS2_9BACT|nr:alpha-L-fucosidase [Coraliomargarita sp. J2-16]WPJ96364.1 alpha-L-fucosidase [Coraliomargarita sp. J2-16]
MKSTIHSLFAAVLLAASSAPATLAAQDHVQTQRADSSVILPATIACSQSDTWSWDFDITHPGIYTLQVVVDIAGAEAAHTGWARLNGELVGQKLKKAYVIEEGLVSEFEQSIDIAGSGSYSLTLASNLSVNKARLVPVGYTSSRISLSSDQYYQPWLKMHQSAPKVAAMEWYRQARFGMFIHWGVYSEAAGSWKGQGIEEGVGPKVAEWIQFAFKISREEYRAYAKNFNPDQTFAVNIAQLAKATGMNYVVITAKHHDGFALFDSACSDWDIADATDYDGDLVKELYDACRAEGLDFGVYYSHGNDWGEGSDGNYANVKAYNDTLGVATRPNGKNLWDPSPNTHVEYLENKAYPQIAELIELLPDLRLIWFDGEGLITEAQAFRFYEMVYELNPNIIVNRRVGYDFGDYIDAGDNKTPAANELAAKHFETCGTANHSWGFKAHDHHWKSGNQLLRNFVDIVSKGGNYLLNIGPDGKGTVPEPCVASFHEMGEWVKTNSEAIFGTTRWTPFSEGVDKVNNSKSHADEFWFSSRDDTVYVMSLAANKDSAHIRSLKTSAGIVLEVRLLGSQNKLKWSQDEHGLEVDFTGVHTGPNGYALAVTLQP